MSSVSLVGGVQPTLFMIDFTGFTLGLAMASVWREDRAAADALGALCPPRIAEAVANLSRFSRRGKRNAHDKHNTSQHRKHQGERPGGGARLVTTTINGAPWCTAVHTMRPSLERGQGHGPRRFLPATCSSAEREDLARHQALKTDSCFSSPPIPVNNRFTTTEYFAPCT